jgi:hypothetical protein
MRGQLWLAHATKACVLAEQPKGNALMQVNVFTALPGIVLIFMKQPLQSSR